MPDTASGLELESHNPREIQIPYAVLFAFCIFNNCGTVSGTADMRDCLLDAWKETRCTGQSHHQQRGGVFK